MPKKQFHFRNLRTSVPLQKVYLLLADGQERTTREVNRGADVECGPTIVSELNANGCVITTERKGAPGSYLWYYRMMQGVEWADQVEGLRRAA